MSFAVALTIVGCGGGGGDAPATAQILGTITSVDGSTLSREGIIVTSGGGDVAVTGADGSFTFDVPAGTRIRLSFEDPEHEGEPQRDDVEESGDHTPDGTDIDGDEVELDSLDEDEHCEIEVELENGEVTSCRVDRPERDGEDDERPEIEAECRLKPVEGSSEPEAVAEAELESEEGCCVLEIEVGGVLSSDVLTVVLECEEVQAELGMIEIIEGRGRFELEHCIESDQSLPFGAASLRDLAGCWLLLLDDAGEVALVGCMPGKRHREDDGDEGDDDDERPDRFVEDASLESVEGGSEPEASGGAVVRCEEDCCVLVVEVGGIANSEALSVVISCEGTRVEVADVEIVEGRGRIEVEYCGDTPRPFEVESLKQLGACELLVLDGAGEVALAGAFPGMREGEHDGDEEASGE